MNILQPGSLVGKYPVTRLISVGGMGMLYEAIHPVLGTRVAIKTIRPELAHDAVVVERFLKEALSASRVRDERLPGILDHDYLPDGSPYMVMELLEGEDLAQRLAAGPVAPAYATRVIVEVLEVLARVHGLGIIHRDIKPQNIFLARSDLLGEVPKLLDFGVAHIASDAMTRPGELMGTPMYMALEQALPERRVGPWTDVFSAGVVLYECLAGQGRRPWGQISPLAYITRLSTGSLPTPLQDVAPDAPAGLCDAVMKALAVQPEARFPDALSFRQAIEEYAQPRLAAFAGMRSPAAPSVPLTGTAETAWALRVPRLETAQLGQTRPGALPTPSDDALRRLRERLGRIGKPIALQSNRLRPGERRHVVVLALSFDLVAGEAVGLEPEAVDELLASIVGIFDRELDRVGGHVEQHLGRTLLATFGYDAVREDDAERAAAAALRLVEVRGTVEQALSEVGCGLHVRTGLHAGFLTRTLEEERSSGLRTAVRTATSAAAGDTVNVARFLESVAPLNGIYASRAVREAAGPHYHWRAMGAQGVRGRARPVDVFELLGREASGWRARPRRPFVGREPSLRALLQWIEARDGEGPAVGLVVGPPGYGKTRLIQEATLRLQAVRPAACVLFAEGVADQPYGLWAGVLRAVLADEDEMAALVNLGTDAGRPELAEEVELVRLLLGRSEPDAANLGAPDVLRGRIRRLLVRVLEAAARRSAEQGGPTVVVLDALHRADEASLDLLESVAGGVRGPAAPLFLLGARAVSIFELPASLPVLEVPVGRLTDDEVDALVDRLADGRPVSDAVRALVRDRAVGCPLFVEELLASLLDDELGGADTVVLAQFRVPDSLYGMLLARVARLTDRLQEVVRHLSVFGPSIRPNLWIRVSDALAVQDEQTRPGNRTTAVDELNALVGAGILEERSVEGRLEYGFRQGLLREAVYATVLPENRRLLHRLVAAALETLPPGERPGLEPQLLAHYHQAGAVERTLHYARRVGRRALRLGAYGEACPALQLACSAQDRLASEPLEQRAETLLDLAWALLYLGRFAAAQERARDAVDRVGADHPALAGRGHLACAQVAVLRGEWEEARLELEMAEHRFEQTGDVLQTARARSTLGFVLRCMGRPQEGLEHAEAGWGVLREAGDRAALLRAAHDLGNVLRDLDRMEEALAVFDEALERVARIGDQAPQALGPGEEWVEPAVRSGRAIICAELGRLGEAITTQRAVYEMGVEHGNKVTQTISAFHLARHLRRADDLRGASEFARRALDLAGEVGMPERAVRARLLLAEIAGAADEHQEQLEHLAAAEFIARTAFPGRGQAADLLWFKAVGPLVGALWAAGQHERLERLAEAAAERARRSVDPAVEAAFAELRLGGHLPPPPSALPAEA